MDITNEKKWNLRSRMIAASMVGLIAMVAAGYLLMGAGHPKLSEKTRVETQSGAEVQDLLANLPISFEANQGQEDAAVRYSARGRGYDLWLTGDGATLRLNHKELSVNDGSTSTGDVLQLRLAGANAKAGVSGESELAGKANYFAGSDQSKWQRDVPLYAKVKYAGVYEGIDLVYYGDQQQLEYDFVVSPNSDPASIKIQFKGAENVSINDEGELVLHAAGGDLSWHKPVSYQENDGVRREVASSYVVNENNEIGFALGDYDRSRPLTIDPTLAYGTYFGQAAQPRVAALKVDAAGNAYILGSASNTPNYPTTPGSYKTVFDCPVAGPPCENIWVTKINPTGSALVYSTFIGEGIVEAGTGGIAVDTAGNVYLTGSIVTTIGFPLGWPVTAGAYQTTSAGKSEAFVTKLNAAGNAIVFSTLFGGHGDDIPQSIALDSNNNVVIAGGAYSYRFNEPFDFPLTPGAWFTTNGLDQGFVAKFSSNGSTLMYSTLIPAFNSPGSSLAVDGSGNAYVFFRTYDDWVPNSGHNRRFPTTPSAFQLDPSQQGTGNDCVLAKINPTGSALLYGTYLGGTSGEVCSGVAVDNAGRAYVKGFTQSPDFDITSNAFDQLGHISNPNTALTDDAFVSVIDTNASGAASLVYSTYLGGSLVDQCNSGEKDGDIAIDASKKIWITGSTKSSNFPVTADALQTTFAGVRCSAYISKIDPTRSGSSSLVYSTFYGTLVTGDTFGTDIALDGLGNVYVAGRGDYGLITTPGSYEPDSNSAGLSGFLIKVAAGKIAFDYDGDGKTDASVYRPSNNSWFLYRSTAGFAGYQFGAAGDAIVPADYTGDGKTDVAIWRPSNGSWYILRSEDSTLLFGGGFGTSGDIPVPGDFDGDGRADIAVYRPGAQSYWYLNQSTAGFAVVPFGVATDKPAMGDFDGDGKTDISVYRPSLGQWFRFNSGNGSFYGVQFGAVGDMIVPADYTGDGKTDNAIFRPSTSTWYVLRSESPTFYGAAFGAAGDIPSPGDYDGDGKADLAVWRPGAQGIFYIQQSTAGFAAIPWGLAGDRPTANAYVY